MRREDVAALLPIIKAWGEGKEIQYFNSITKTWGNIGVDNPSFTMPDDKYRIAPEKKKGWINIYKNSTGCDATGGYIYQSKEAADMTPTSFDRVACIEIEYEEGQGL